MKKILVIDDESSVRTLLTRVLTAADYAVVVAEDGLVGLEKVKSERPDLIISDVLMPQIDGVSLCAALQSNPATQNIPFLFVTTQTKIGQVEQAMKESPAGYITKPFDLGRLLQKVQSILRA